MAGIVVLEDDSEEIMSKVGMGVVYTKTSEGKPLRNIPDFKGNNMKIKYMSHDFNLFT